MGEGPRRLWALVQGLPVDAAVWREDRSKWTDRDEFAARSIEAIEHWGRQIILILAGQKASTGVPERIFTHPDRPESAGAEKEITTDSGEIARFFNRMAGRR